MTKAVLGQQGLITEAGLRRAGSIVQGHGERGRRRHPGRRDSLLKGAKVAAGFSAAAVASLLPTGGSLPNLTPPESGDYSGVGGWGPATIG
jgi:hypothetical protein